MTTLPLWGPARPMETVPTKGWVLVELEKPMLGTRYHTMRCSKPCLIGGRFHFDVSKPTGWWPLPGEGE